MFLTLRRRIETRGDRERRKKRGRGAHFLLALPSIAMAPYRSEIQYLEPNVVFLTHHGIRRAEFRRKNTDVAAMLLLHSCPNCASACFTLKNVGKTRRAILRNFALTIIVFVIGGKKKPLKQPKKKQGEEDEVCDEFRGENR